MKSLSLRWARTSPRRYISWLRRQGVMIGENISFHGGLKTVSIDTTRPSLVVIGDNISFNHDFTLLTHDWGSFVFRCKFHEFVPSSGMVRIGSNCVFGRNVTVFKGVTIGENCIIGAGSIVTKSIPSDSVVAGVPAKVICSLEEYYAKRQKKSVEEAFEYARSIQERFHRRPVVEDFWEEFPLFVSGDEVGLYPSLPIRKQLGVGYADWVMQHKAPYHGLDEFLKAAGL